MTSGRSRNEDHAGRGGPSNVYGGVQLDADALAYLARHPHRPRHALSAPEFEARRRPLSRGHLASHFRPHGPDRVPEQTPAPTQRWMAQQSTDDYCADTQIAVSRSHVVVTTRTTIAFFDRAGTSVQPPLYVGDLFKNLNLAKDLGIKAYFDTRTIFDPHRRRFWIGALAVRYVGGVHADHRTKFVCAVSLTENPLDGFWLYWWDAVAHDGVEPDPVFMPGDWGDYPILGIDAHCVYQTNHVIGSSVWNRYGHIMVLPAGDLAAGKPGPIPGWQFWDLMMPDGVTPAWAFQAAVHHGSEPRAYFLGPLLEPDRLLVWGLDDPLGPAQHMRRAEVRIGSVGGVHNGAQRGSKHPLQFDNTGNDPIKAAVHGNLMIGSMNDAAPWDTNDGLLAACRITELDLAGWPVVRLARERVFGSHNVLDDPPDARFHYGWPAAELNRGGDIVVVFARTGRTIFPEVRFSVWRAGEADIRPSRILKSGEAAYRLDDHSAPPDALLPWADVAGVTVDSVDGSVWFAHCYADGRHQGNNFSTWVGRL